MEKAKLYFKVTLCIMLVMAATVAGSASLAFGDVRWQSVAILLAAWWLSFLVLSIVLLDINDIYGFVKRTVQHQLKGPKGNFMLWLFLVTMFFAACAWAVNMYGMYYVDLIQYGNDAEGIIALAITVFLLAVAKTYGYHRYDTKGAKTDSHEYVPVDSLLA